MWKNRIRRQQTLLAIIRHYSRISPPPPPAYADPVIRVSKTNIAHLGGPKKGPKPRQLLSLPPFPGHPLPGKNSGSGKPGRVTAISWVKYYFDEIADPVIQSHFNKGLVSVMIVMKVFKLGWFYFSIFNFLWLVVVFVWLSVLGYEECG
jgi:hypothetical protein